MTRKLNARILPLLSKLEYAAAHKPKRSWQAGIYRSLFKGKGMANLIDWKASVRTQETLVKQYVEERNVISYVLVDVSQSMVFGSTEQLKCEYAAELAGALAYAILESDDTMGFGLFANGPVFTQRLGKGPTQMYVFAKAILNPDNYGGVFNLGNAANLLQSFLPPRATVILISDFLGMPDNWDRPLSVLAQKYDVAAVMVLDPRDLALPQEAMQVVLSHPVSGEQLLVDTAAIRQQYSQEAGAIIDHTAERLKRKGIDVLRLTTDKPFERPMRKFFLGRSH